MKTISVFLFSLAMALILFSGCGQVDPNEPVPVDPDTVWKKAAGYADWTGRDYHAAVEFKGKMWILGGQDSSGKPQNDIWSSSDGVNWKRLTAPWSARHSLAVVVHDEKIWVLGGYDVASKNDVWCSSDCVSWTPITLGHKDMWSIRYQHRALEYDGKIWIIGGYNGTSYFNDVWYSSNGLNWTRATASAFKSARRLFSVTKNEKGMWLFGGNNGSTYYSDFYSSIDGITWKQESTSTGWNKRAYHDSLYFNGKMWVIGGYDSAARSNEVFYSDNFGLTWSQVPPANIPWTGRYVPGACIVYNNKIWITGGYDGTYQNDVWSSADGYTWKSNHPEWPKREYSKSLSYDGKLWILGGYDGTSKNDVWSSTDGYNWESKTAAAAWTPRYGHGSVVYKRDVIPPENERMWVIGGYDSTTSTYYNDVYSSEDGVTWTKHTQDATTWPVRAFHSAVVFKNLVWVMGGATSTYYNDIWVSSDLETWTKRTPTGTGPDTFWSTRRMMATAVYKISGEERLFVFGGNGSTYYNDVWSTADGSTWVKEIDSAIGLSKRRGHQCIVYNDKLWIFGGYDGSATFNDMYWSEDGKSWTPLLNDKPIFCPWLKRGHHTSVLHDNKIWLLGGWDTTATYLRDAWYFNIE